MSFKELTKKPIRHNLNELQLLEVVHALMILQDNGLSGKVAQIVKDDLKLN